MGSVIRHSGIIERIDDGCVKVRILQTSACASCKVAGHCSASESKEKTVDVSCEASRQWVVGQPVTVVASRGVASMAVLLGFGLPLLIMLAALLVVLWRSHDEGTAALASVLVLAPYYLALWMVRDRISRQVTFKIEDCNIDK